jgi:hypothetical protein
MKTYGGVDVFLTKALAGFEESASRTGRFTPGERTTSVKTILYSRISNMCILCMVLKRIFTASFKSYEI